MSKQEQIMQAVEAVVVAIGGGTPTFKTVDRKLLNVMGLSDTAKPACGIQRMMDRGDQKYNSIENVKTKLVFRLQVIATSADDTELLTLKAALNTALLNNTLGRLCSPIEYFGADAALFATMPAGSELVAYVTEYSETKPAVH